MSDTAKAMTRYTFTIWQTPDGMDHAKWGDLTASNRHGATMALARKIVFLDGMEDLPVDAVDETGRLRFSARSVYRLAGLTIAESDRTALQVKPHMPFSGVAV